MSDQAFACRCGPCDGVQPRGTLPPALSVSVPHMAQQHRVDGCLHLERDLEAEVAEERREGGSAPRVVHLAPPPPTSAPRSPHPANSFRMSLLAMPSAAKRSPSNGDGKRREQGRYSDVGDVFGRGRADDIGGSAREERAPP